MTRQLLEEIRDRLKAVCPIDVRIASSCKPVPGHEPFIVLAQNSVETVTNPIIQNSFIYIPVKAEISAAVYVPSHKSALDASVILSKHILPVMAQYGCIRGFHQSAVAINGITKGYKAEATFKVSGYCKLTYEEVT